MKIAVAIAIRVSLDNACATVGQKYIIYEDTETNRPQFKGDCDDYHPFYINETTKAWEILAGEDYLRKKGYMNRIEEKKLFSDGLDNWI